MFKPNTDHLQQYLFGTTFSDMPDKIKNRLTTSWAGVFYTDLFCKINESIFQKIFSDTKSRPNTPVNVLVGLEILKSGFGWTDEEMYDNFLYNLQVRYALGLQDLDEGNFELRTVYNFRKRLSEYMQETGENPIDEMLAQVNNEQMKEFLVKSEQQRMDSVLVGSNIRNMTRLQLLVEVINRVWKMLNDDEKKKYNEDFSAYIKVSAVQYCYRVKSDDVGNRITTIGIFMDKLLKELSYYENEKAYEVLKRAFNENFKITNDLQISPKENHELKASNLQSPDDTDATYRKKGKDTSKGYVGNIAETCDDGNDLQLITKVQVAPNTIDDQTLLKEALPDLKKRTDIKKMFTDGAYTGKTADDICSQNDVELCASAIRGSGSKKNNIKLCDFEIEKADGGTPKTVKCPEGESADVKQCQSTGKYICEFDNKKCSGCVSENRCPVVLLKRKNVRVLKFNSDDWLTALRIKKSRQHPEYVNKRASVESSVRSIIHPLGGHLCKLPVRGIERVTQMFIYGALMVNIRRIYRYKTHNSDFFSNIFIFYDKIINKSLRVLFICKTLKRKLGFLA